MQKVYLVLGLSFLLLLSVVFLDLGMTGNAFLNIFSTELYQGNNLLIALTLLIFILILISLTYAQLYQHMRKRKT
ncbi:hypothetical protein HYS48_01140 [Candidatus Woesearchaeota archaeon]|nr:hypothetical protein [Candidatus Woesearchaeota archaeon]